MNFCISNIRVLHTNFPTTPSPPFLPTWLGRLLLPLNMVAQLVEPLVQLVLEPFVFQVYAMAPVPRSLLVRCRPPSSLPLRLPLPSPSRRKHRLSPVRHFFSRGSACGDCDGGTGRCHDWRCSVRSSGIRGSGAFDSRTALGRSRLLAARTRKESRVFDNAAVDV